MYGDKKNTLFENEKEVNNKFKIVPDQNTLSENYQFSFHFSLGDRRNIFSAEKVLRGKI